MNIVHSHLFSICSCPSLFHSIVFWFILYPLIYFPSLPQSPPPPYSLFLLVQLVSEQAYGFFLFDYITGSLEGEAERGQLL